MTGQRLSHYRLRSHTSEFKIKLDVYITKAAITNFLIYYTASRLGRGNLPKHVLYIHCMFHFLGCSRSRISFLQQPIK